MKLFDRSTKTGEIVIKVPQTSSILKKYRIDFCCGGIALLVKSWMRRTIK